MAKPDFDEIGALGIPGYGGWITAAYSADLRWPFVYPIYEKMRRADPEVSSVRMVYGTMASGVRIEFKLPENPSDDDKKFCDFGNSVLIDLEGGINKWRDTLMSNVPFMGWGWWEAVPGVRSATWRAPDGDEWRSKYNDGLIGFRRLAWRDPSSFQRWDRDDKTGRVSGLYQMAPPNPLSLIPSTNSVHITFGDADNPEGLTPLEAVHRLERLKYGYEVVMGIGSEHAAGYLSVTKTEPGDISGDDKTNIRNAARAILSAQEGNYALWPYGFAGEVKDINFAAAGSLLEIVKYYSILKLTVYSMGWIAQNTISGTGSYASVSDSSALWVVNYNAMTSAFTDQLDAQIGARLYEMNKAAFPNITTRPKIVSSNIEKITNLSELSGFFSQLNGVLPLGEQDYLAIRRKSGFLPETLPDVVMNVAPPAPVQFSIPTQTELTALYAAKRERIYSQSNVAELSAQKATIALLASAKSDYSDIRNQYYNLVNDNALAYLVQTGSDARKFKNAIKRGFTEAFPDAFYSGYATGGGQDVEPDDDAWLTERMNAEMGFVDMLFLSLKAVKDEELPPSELVAEAEQRATGYTQSLDGVYAQGVLRGNKNKMLTMVGDDGKESCTDCRKNKGKRYSARKWLRIGIPGVPGNSYECGGWNCEHYLEDDEGNAFTPNG